MGTFSMTHFRRLAVAQRMVAQLKESNAALARTLNAALIDNRRLTEELSEARMEAADQRQKRTERGAGGDRDGGGAGERGWDDAAVEAECQKRLVAYLDTVKASMTKVLDDTFLLTEDVTKTMQLVSAPARRSRSTAASSSVQKTPAAAAGDSAASADASPPPPVSHPMRRAPCAAVGRKPSPSSGGVAVAHVSPRVGGHAIHKPQIEIQRLGADEINRYQEEQRRRRQREEQGRNSIQS